MDEALLVDFGANPRLRRDREYGWITIDLKFRADLPNLGL